MSDEKKKKKKQKKKEAESISILEGIDSTLDGTYRSVKDEIEYYQLLIAQADAKAEKKARKKMRKKNTLYTQDYKKEGRIRVINEMEGNNFLSKIEESLTGTGTVIVIIARLVVALILSILSFEPIKACIKPSTMKKIDAIYKMAMSIT